MEQSTSHRPVFQVWTTVLPSVAVHQVKCLLKYALLPLCSYLSLQYLWLSKQYGLLNWQLHLEWCYPPKFSHQMESLRTVSE